MTTASQKDDAVELFLEHRSDLTVGEKMRKALLLAAIEDIGKAVLNGQRDERISTLTAEEFHIITSAMLTTVEDLRQKLNAFVVVSIENGGDVALAEDEDELMGIGQEILLGRHALELRAAGLHALNCEFEGVLANITAFDRELRANIQYFLCLNELRRAYGKEFGDPERFWWWHLSSGCDPAVAYRAVEGGATTSRLRQCLTCYRLFRQLHAVTCILKQYADLVRSHPTPEQLVAVFEGEADGQTEQWVDLHVKFCASCNEDLRVLERADAANLEEEK